MATTSDIRDIMDLGHAGPKQSAPKKKKRIEGQRIAGVTREVQALMGDSVPPIAIAEQKLYKSKPSIAQKLFKPRHWEERQFQHGARTDGLVLRHWKRSIPGVNRQAAVTTLVDTEMVDGEKENQVEARFEDEFPSEKWNVKVDIPTFSNEQYEAHFKSEEWTKDETDYLLNLCRDFDLRWLLIADRYDPEDIQRSGNEMQYTDRTMEAMKSRYYAIAAKMMEMQTPASTMTQAEFQLWERMRNFDAKTETLRKNMAEKLFERTKDEADEERLLLEELYRITKNEEDFIKLRRDLYSRLEPAPAIRRTERGEEQSTAMYQTSAGLSMLLQTLLAKEKRLKRPPVPNGTESSGQVTPSDAQKWEKGRHPNQYTRRDTMDTQGEEGPMKKGSMSQPVTKSLTPAEESRFGVVHPQERLTSGVQFRHEKINRLTMAKSQVQTSKIQAALTELGIPARLLMPTERVCREFERLVGSINLLLDARKVNEKVTSEIKVLEEARRIRLGIPKEGEEKSDVMDVDQTQTTAESQAEDVEESGIAEDDQDAEGEEEEDDQEEREDNTMQMDERDNEDADGDQDEEDEEDENENAVEKSEVAEDEDDEIDDSLANLGKDDDDDDEDEEEDDEEEEEEDEDEDNDVAVEDEEDRVGPNLGQDASDEEEEEASEEEEPEDNNEEEDEDEEADRDADEDEEDEAEAAADDKEDDSEPSRPVSSHSTRLQKRSASVVSDASKAGSNRSGIGRKKRR